uniref:Uncharacterized protein n=1 Tax=Arundo donax TaxID=35708 RepID=A0A0A9VQ68_ARUDO
MKRITSPASRTSRTILVTLDSNSPLSFVPAISRPTSSDIIRFATRKMGTSPFAIRRASPSAIAVLPTPASPKRIGLFFVRRHII